MLEGSPLKITRALEFFLKLFVKTMSENNDRVNFMCFSSHGDYFPNCLIANVLKITFNICYSVI